MHTLPHLQQEREDGIEDGGKVFGAENEKKKDKDGMDSVSALELLKVCVQAYKCMHVSRDINL
jgi:hypothetical protein